jgi:hypothetical protein
MADDLPVMTVEELDRRCQEVQEELQADIDAYDERAALQVHDDGKTTTERAIAALERPERFPGEHDVARAWLHNDPKARIFRKVTDS